MSFIDKETRIKKAQPVRIKAIPFSKGFKVELEFNFNPYDSADMDQLILKDSYLRMAMQNFIKLIIDETGMELIK
jgi:hypothetical protein